MAMDVTGEYPKDILQGASAEPREDTYLTSTSPGVLGALIEPEGPLGPVVGTRG